MSINKTFTVSSPSFAKQGEFIFTLDANGRRTRHIVRKVLNETTLVYRKAYWFDLAWRWTKTTRIKIWKTWRPGVLLGFLLHYANINPQDKKTFYPIKDRILRRFGRKIGWDVQHIEGVKCNACKNGMHYHYIRDMHAYGYEGCWHCGGTGWYKAERWILLHRYQLGNHVFHLPGSRLTGEMDRPGYPLLDGKIIEGFIDHAWGPSLLAQECTLWVYLLFDIKNLPRVIWWNKGYCTMPPISRPFLFVLNIPNQLRKIADIIHITQEEPWDE